MALCTITGSIADSGELGVPGVAIYATPAINGYSSLVTSTGVYRFVALHPKSAVTNDAGEFSITLTSGFSYRIVIRVIGLDEVITVPISATPVNLFTLLGVSVDSSDTGTGTPQW